jgi:hypothetical protein
MAAARRPGHHALLWGNGTFSPGVKERRYAPPAVRALIDVLREYSAGKLS